MAGLDWLTARPVAHRGLHDAAAGVIENTPTAFSAAIAAGYGIELDLQITADGEAVVHHDDALGRLTDGSGPLAALTAAELKRVPFKATSDRIITVGELLDLVAGRTTLLIELKSRYDSDRRLPLRAAQVLSAYGGPAALMSFDPFQIALARDAAPALARGLIAQRARGRAENTFGARLRRSATYLSNLVRSRPQFIAYSLLDLPALPPLIARNIFGLPLLTWTVRSEEDQARAAKWADQIIFEGIRP
jgi:glycerophosphoryl diester phosphodiesterase